MSTRGGIGYVVGDTGIHFVYQHFDSYVTGLGAELLAAHQRVGGDIQRLRREAVDEHPQGWSSYPDSAYDPNDPPMLSTCRCGTGDYTGCDALFIEYLYVLNSAGLGVYKSAPTGQTRSNTRPSDGFQWESPLYRHVFVGTLPWNADLAAINAMEERASEIAEAIYEEVIGQ